ncbi:MAG: sulfite exporter TauE/SafE family protein [Kiritimatiellae bacterium]|nr:sulfite exporter TauE/SafE family protein [Kiritimatiellia bacterium]
MPELIVGSAAIFLASLVQGCAGFGFSLVAVPALMLFAEQQRVVPICVALSMLLNGVAVYECRRHLLAAIVVPLTIGGVLGVPIGTHILTHVNAVFFKLGVGAFVVVLAGVLMAGWKKVVRNQKAALFPVGVSSGVLNGSISMSGPPAILFLANQQTPKAAFRANLMGYFFLLNVFTTAYFACRGLFSRPVLTNVAVYFPLMIVGTLLGIRLSKRIPEPLFRRIALLIVGLMGLILLGKSIAAL